MNLIIKGSITVDSAGRQKIDHLGEGYLLDIISLVQNFDEENVENNMEFITNEKTKLKEISFAQIQKIASNDSILFAKLNYMTAYRLCRRIDALQSGDFFISKGLTKSILRDSNELRSVFAADSIESFLLITLIFSLFLYP